MSERQRIPLEDGNVSGILSQMHYCGEGPVLDINFLGLLIRSIF